MDTFSMSLSRRNLFHAGLAVIAVSITAGCTFQKPEEAASDVASPDAQAVLKLATGFVIQNLAPLRTGLWDNEFGYTELLLRSQPDGNPADWLLKDAVNKNDRTWRFSLKGNVTFQNGSPLGADQLATLMTQHLTNNKTVMEQLPGAAVAIDQDKSLLLTTQAPTPGLRNILADGACFTVFNLLSCEDTGDDPQGLIDAKIYAGPYVPVSLSSEKLVMTAGPTYWNRIPGLGGVEVFFISDVGVRIKTVRNGEMDIVLYPSTQWAKSLEGSTRAKLGLGEPGGPSLRLITDVVKPVLAEAKVRRALLRLIDYKILATDMMWNFYEPISSFYDPKFPYVIDIWKTDVAETGQLLGEAGAAKSDNGWLLSSEESIVFELLTYPQQPDSDTLALAPQAQFKKHGIQVTIRQVSDTTVEVEGSNWDIGAVNSGTVSFGGNPISSLQRCYHTDGDRNYSHINDPEPDAFTDELAVTPDETVAKDLLVGIQQRIDDQSYNGFCGRRHPAIVIGQQVPKYTPRHVLIWVDASTHVGVRATMHALRRTGRGLLFLLVISIAIWSLTAFTPGDPALRILRAQSTLELTVKQVELLRAEPGSNRLLILRYLDWVTGLVRGDLRSPWAMGRPISDESLSRLPVTVLLTVVALLLTLALAMVSGIPAALWAPR